MAIKFSSKGIGEVKRKLGSRAASDLADALDTDVGVETRKMAVDAAKRAPVETGALRASILSSTKKERPMRYYFGSYMPYARRQEYEHKTKKFFLRGAFYKGERALPRVLKATILKRLKG